MFLDRTKVLGTKKNDICQILFVMTILQLTDGVKKSMGLILLLILLLSEVYCVTEP